MNIDKSGRIIRDHITEDIKPRIGQSMDVYCHNAETFRAYCDMNLDIIFIKLPSGKTLFRKNISLN